MFLVSVSGCFVFLQNLGRQYRSIASDFPGTHGTDDCCTIVYIIWKHDWAFYHALEPMRTCFVKCDDNGIAFAILLLTTLRGLAYLN